MVKCKIEAVSPTFGRALEGVEVPVCIAAAPSLVDEVSVRGALLVSLIHARGNFETHVVQPVYPCLRVMVGVHGGK